jgi:hypothetical protein
MQWIRMHLFLLREEANENRRKTNQAAYGSNTLFIHLLQEQKLPSHLPKLSAEMFNTVFE